MRKLLFWFSTVQKIWRTHGLAPHRLRTFKLSRDPLFASRIRDVVGLYVDPPAHAVVLSVHSLVDLQAAINRYPAEHNQSPKPFVRTADPDAIIAAAIRGYQVLDSIH